MFSELIAGTMRWGVWGANHSVKEIQKLIQVCVEENITTFDHADIYGGHTTEELFGNAWKDMDLKRENLQFISKCGIEMPCENRNFKIKSYNYSKEHILNSVQNSLENLKTDYLDLLLLHRPSPLINPEEIAEVFDSLREQKKVRHFGVSNFSPSQFNLMNDAFPIITNQVEISINNVNAFYDGTLDQMMLQKLQPMAWSVMGNYFSVDSEENKRIKEVLKELCIQYNATENQILLAFLLKHPAKILPVIGTSQIDTIKKFKEALSIDLDREDWFKLLEAKKGNEVA